MADAEHRTRGSPLSKKDENIISSEVNTISLQDKENTPPSLNSTRVLASRTARKIFDHAEAKKSVTSNADEPLLRDNPRRFVIFPIQY
ncbi:unnamed protein product [Boreogadus saida]